MFTRAKNHYLIEYAVLPLWKTEKTCRGCRITLEKSPDYRPGKAAPNGGQAFSFKTQKLPYKISNFLKIGTKTEKTLDPKRFNKLKKTLEVEALGMRKRRIEFIEMPIRLISLIAQRTRKKY